MVLGPDTKPPSARFRELDVFRGLAAAWVVYFHFVFKYGDIYGHPEHVRVPFAIPLIVDNGQLPVDWFFMISGFVIVWTLERCANWKDFAVSRFSRLYPAFWAAVLITFVVGRVVPLPGQSYGLGQLAINLTMLQDLVQVDRIDSVYWSLTVELMFYLLMGLVFAFGLMRRIHWICLAWVLACIANTELGWAHRDLPWKLQELANLRYGHFLIAGVMFFQLWRGQRPYFSGAILALCLISVAATLEWLDFVTTIILFVAFGLAIKGRLRWITAPPFLWLASISYTLYLCHQMIGYRVIAFLEAQGVSSSLADLGAVIAVLLLADAISRGIERPAMRAIRRSWRNRLPTGSLAGI